MLSILLAAALSGMWDDESFLGRGPAVGAGVAVEMTRHLSGEGELGWGEHHRDAGYLKVDGNAITAVGRLSFAFRDPGSAVRPFVSAGASWVRSTDLFAQPRVVNSPSGQPILVPDFRTTHRTSLVGWEFGAGAEIKASEHIKIRPEARWIMTAAGSSFTPGSIEPPLWLPRAGVTLIWSPGK